MNQTYPATMLCEVCRERMTDVVGPSDWAVCWLCDLELKDGGGRGMDSWMSLSLALKDEAMAAWEQQREGATRR